MNCLVCGGDHLRCGCISQQPFCEQCAENTKCNFQMDALCVIYHPDNDSPSQLTNLNLSNLTNLEVILEAIDDALGNSGLLNPIIAQNTSSIIFNTSGNQNHTISARVRISPNANNQLSILNNGLYVSPSAFVPDYRVKVDEDDDPAYLEDQIDGSSNEFVDVNVVNQDGIMVVSAELDIDALADEICERCTDTFSLFRSCENIEIFENFILGQSSNGFVKIPVIVTGTGVLTVIATTPDSQVFGTITQSVTPSTPYIMLPIQYTGSGSDGVKQLTIQFLGMFNTVSNCTVEFEIDSTEECIDVTFETTPVLPDAYENTPYNYVINLNGSAPFSLDNVVKPAWMTISLVGNSITLSGTPLAAATNVAVSFDVTNCEEGEVSVDTTIDVVSVCIPVSFSLGTILPDGEEGTPYNYSIALSGTLPFAVDSIVKPSWMSITVVGSNLQFSGTPTSAIDEEVSFRVYNSCGEQSLTQTINIYLNICQTYFIQATPSVSIEWIDCDDNTLSQTLTGGQSTIVCVKNHQIEITSGSGTIENLNSACGQT